MSKRIPTTLQGIFNRISKHLLTQNSRSGVIEYDGFACMMLDPKGRKCAVGCLLTKKQALANQCGDPYSVGFDGAAASLLANLQRVHDAHKPYRWPGALRQVAKHHNLKIPVFLEIV